jgi:CxxC motif-containing protein (DUF1111 family)
MRTRSLITWLALSGSLASLQAAQAASGFEIADATREAYARINPEVTQEQRAEALRGRSLFRQSWVVPPAKDIEIAGLGPLYNQLSCLSCHPKNGRGQPPENPQQAMRSMLVRLSLPGQDPHGGPLPHPVYGTQLNEQGVPGVSGEGWVRVDYREERVTLPDGETVGLRAPLYQFADLHYGPLGDVQFSPRVGPPVFGLGLLEAVADQTIVQLAEQGRQQGVNGHPNYVWDAESSVRPSDASGSKPMSPRSGNRLPGLLSATWGLPHRCTRRETAALSSLPASSRRPPGGPN